MEEIMKKIIFSIILAILITTAFTVTSVSTVNSFSEIENNPAALSTENYQGIGFNVTTYDDFESDNWSAFLYSKHFGYFYNENNGHHRLHLASKTSFNDISYFTLYSGYSVNFLDNKIENAFYDYYFCIVRQIVFLLDY